MSITTKVRDEMVSRMEEDLIGPMSPEEILYDYPSDKYLTGILFPRQMAIPESEDDELPGDDDDDGSDDMAVPLSQCIRPASAGLSCILNRRQIFRVLQNQGYDCRRTVRQAQDNRRGR